MASPAFLSRGFRPFFLGATVFAIVALANWMAVYHFGRSLELVGVTMFQWHAHEMVFGYAMGVVAGFLLTAAWNWTGMKTASGAGLAALFLAWLIARILMLGGTALLAWATLADLLFMAGLWFAITRPVARTRQARQIPVLVMLLLLMAARVAFWLGAAGHFAEGTRIGVYGGLYVVLGLVLFMGRRVIPFFTARGVGYEVELRNERWNDSATTVLFPLFLLCEIFLPGHMAGALLAGALLVLNTLRLMDWHTLGVWMRPLLWSLFMGMLMINLGFLLRALMPVTQIPPFLPVHAYAVGGIGILTISMMARVTLGHTGRDVHQPPRVVVPMLGLLLLATVLRIFLPLTDPAHYAAWVGVSAIAWIAGFLVFVVVFGPMLVRERADKPKDEKKDDLKIDVK